MKITAQNEIRDTPSIELPPIHVAMHVLGVARTDVRVIRAATALVTAGTSVTVVDLDNPADHTYKEQVQGICFQHVHVSRSFLLKRFERGTMLKALSLFVRCLWQLLHTPADIYHAHDVSALPACAFAAFCRRKPLVFEAHELPLFERPWEEMSPSRRLLHRVLTLLLAVIIPRCAGVITVSPPIVEDLQRRYAISRIALLRNVPPYRLVAKSQRLRTRLGLSPQTRIVLYQGNLQPNRELDRLVRAAAFFESGIVLVLMGKGIADTVPQLEQLIAQEKLADQVKILPAVPYEDLLDWTASADLGLAIFSSEYSRNVSVFLPNKLFEYIMAGVPVVCSQIAPIVDVVTRFDVGWCVSSLTPKALAQAIMSSLADDAVLAHKRQHALEAARSELCWEAEKPRLIQLYRQIVVKERV